MSKKLTTDEFIKRARGIHGDKYDYSKVVYKAAHNKIEIICPMHGVFFQEPTSHLAGRDCPKCGLQKISKSKRLTKEKFVIKSRKIHRHRYDYSLVEYVKNYIKVKIICPVHGVFEQSPEKHMKGQGCPICSNRINKTTEQFIEQAKEAHGDRYDYSLVEYENAHSKVKIICSEHGAFEQSAIVHLKGSKCPRCAGRGINTDIFIENAIKIHGNKYSYEKTKYKVAIKKVIITCPIHGDFKQTPNTHLGGKGCKKCGIDNRAMKRTKTQEEFIKGAIKVHGDTYDYTLVDYKKTHTKVKIICKTHGVFEQSPSNHLFDTGKGCPYCANVVKKTTEQFIEQAKEVHGDKYDYSLVEYINGDSKVKIICDEHGVFEQIAYVHSKGSGCPYCYGNVLLTTEQFIEKAREVHNDSYDYSLVEYEKSTLKVKIICRVHGVFKQLASGHLDGKGCQKCQSSKGEIEVRNTLDKLMIEYAEQYKFNGCKYKNRLPFDFYIPHLNTAIEFNGSQHYSDNYLYYKSEKDFEKRKLYDKIKSDYCKENDIKLIVIPYTEINNIEEILTKELKPPINHSSCH